MNMTLTASHDGPISGTLHVETTRLREGTILATLGGQYRSRRLASRTVDFRRSNPTRVWEMRTSAFVLVVSCR